MKISKIFLFFLLVIPSYNYCQPILDSIDYLSKNHQWDTSLVAALERMAWRKLDQKDTVAAFHCLSKSFSIAKSITDPEALLNSYQAMAEFYLSKSDFDSMDIFMSKYIPLSKKLHGLEGEGNGWDNKGDYYSIAGGYADAIICYQKALELRYAAHDSDGIEMELFGIANTYQMGKQMDSSIHYYKRFLREARKSSDIYTGAMSNLASIFQNTKKFDDAINLYRQALFEAETELDTSKIIGLLGNIAIAFKQQKKIREAISIYDTILRFTPYLTKEKRGTFRLRFALVSLAQLYTELDSANISLRLYYHAIKLAENDSITRAWYQSHEVERLHDSLVISKGLARCYLLLGNFDSSMQNLTTYSRLSDTLYRKYTGVIEEAKTSKYNQLKKENLFDKYKAELKEKSLLGKLQTAIIITLITFFFAIGLFAIQRVRILRRDKKIARQEIEDLLKKQELEIYNTIINSQEEERKRIATDLHDRLGSMLATIKIHFNAFEEQVSNSQLSKLRQYQKTSGLLDDACDEVRRIAHNLSSGIIMQFGLQAALKELLDSIQISGIMTTKLLIFGLQDHFDKQSEIEIYRILQECISNVLRHAYAKSITIQLNCSEDYLTITVEDDGAGFDTKNIKAHGIGLKNISTRTEKLGGKVSIDSTIGKGTTFIIEIPILLKVN